MQTHRVIETIRWIQSTYAPLEGFLNGDIQSNILHARLGRPRKGDGEAQVDLVQICLAALQASGAILVDVEKNSDALKVLSAFGLRMLADRTFLLRFVGVALEEAVWVGKPADDSNRRPGPEFISAAHSLSPKWASMCGCIGPLMLLTVPEELQSKANDSILSIEISDRPNLELEVVSNVLKFTTSLYVALAEVHGREDVQKLEVVKIETGSNFTISLKGLAEIVAEVKKLIIEIWSKHRHKRADEIINHNRAISSGIEVLEKIESLQKKKTLQPEHAERLKRAVVGNTLSLFKSGALVTEIPPIEVVDNRDLLSSFTAPRLLEAGDDIDVEQPLVDPPVQAKLRARKPGPRKRLAK